MALEEWISKTLGEIARVTSGGTPSKSEPKYWDAGSIPWIRTTEIQNCHLNPDDACKFITEDGLKNSSAKLLPKGTILLAMIGQGKTRGQVALLRFKATTNQNSAAIILNDNSDPEFYYNFLLSRYKQIRAASNSAGQSNLSGALVKTIRVPVPPFAEQKKIAQILSTWNQSITATERLLENSQQRKKGLMQQLLTGKKRLVPTKSQLTPKKTRTGEIPGDWGHQKIADICSQVTNKNINGQKLPVLACSKHVGFVDSLSYFKKRVYSEDLTGYRVIPRGCIGFPANHVEEGSIGLQNLYDYGLVSPIYVVARPDTTKVNADYLYAVLKTDHYRQIFRAATNASVDRRGSLRWREFSQIHLPLPPLPEQNQIAEVLKLAAQEIDTLKTGLVLLKQEKRALMQQLLTGKQRVQVEAA